MAGDDTTCELLVIGGGPAATETIRAYRERGGSGPVALVSDEDVLPYNRPPLSKDFLRGDTQASELPLEPSDWYDGVDVHLANRAVDLDTDSRIATLADGHRLAYAACVLATGSRPTPIPVPGADHPGVLLLRSLASAHQLRTRAATARTAIVLGSGFIGCEAAVSLARRGLDVTLVSQEHQPQQARLGDATGRRIGSWLAEEGVALILGAEIAGIDDGRTIRVTDGPTIAADLVLCGGGVRPRSELAAAAGIPLNHGRVVVDEHMRSTVDGLHAAGDVAYAHNAAAGRPLVVEHWGEALRMGAVAGACAAGVDERWAQAPGFWTQIGDRQLKYVAWGDGFDGVRVDDGDGEAFTAWYTRDGVLVGALTYEADDDYDRAAELIEHGRPAPTRR